MSNPENMTILFMQIVGIVCGGVFLAVVFGTIYRYFPRIYKFLNPVLDTDTNTDTNSKQ